VAGGKYVIDYGFNLWLGTYTGHTLGSALKACWF
jgi:hypothetical protein